MAFIKWLGMRVSDHVEQRIFGGSDQTAPSNKEESKSASDGNITASDLRATVSPKTKKTRKKLRVKTPVEISCEIMCENLRTILDETQTCGVPLGINVESVSGYRDEIDATHDLFRSLQSIMLNHQGMPWVVRWHSLELSDRRRQLSLPRPESGRVQRAYSLEQSSDRASSLLLGVAVGAAAVGLGFFLGCRNKA